MLNSLWMDLRYAVRGMLRSPGLTTVAVLSLALGIGANTVIFSFVNALILKTLPVRDPQALVFFGPANTSGNTDGFPNDSMSLFSYSMYREIAQKNDVFSGVTALGSSADKLYGIVGNGGALEAINVHLVSGTYFNVLGVNPILGRALTPDDDQTLGGHPVAVISYGWWSNRFSQDPSIVGKTFQVTGVAYTIIGVAPRGFLGTTVAEPEDAWIPLQMADAISRGPHKLDDKFYQWLDVIARRKPGVSVASARANVNVILKGTLQEYAGGQPSHETRLAIEKARIDLTSASAGKSLLRNRFADPLWMLLGIVGLVLLIACANIANLLLARGAMRQREITVRMALGAGRGRLVRQLLTEAVVLAGIGGALGFASAIWASDALLRMVSVGPARIQLDVSSGGKVLGFALVVSLCTVALFGIIPAVRATEATPAVSLAAGRSTIASHRHSMPGKALIVGQISLSLVLLIVAGLFVRSLINLANVDTGFRQQNVLTIRIDSRSTGFTEESQLGNFYHQVEDRVNALPGAKASSFSVWAFNQGAWNQAVWAEGDSASPPADRDTDFDAVGTGYFATLGLPILEGRALGPQDTATSPKVAVVSETMARRFFPGGLAVGKRFGVSPTHTHDVEVIGVVRDAKFFSLDEKPQAVVYFPYTQYEPSWGIGLYLGDFQVRFAGDPRPMIAAVRRAIAEVNPNVPIRSVQSLAGRVDDSVASQRLIAQISGFFGILAVFLACIGIYGLMSFAVNRRTNEIGIRMALGATRTNVLRMVMGEVLALFGIGFAIGVPGAITSGQLAASMLFGLKPTDPLTLGAAALLLLCVAAVAGYMPARRAAKVDPMVALRYE